METVTMIILSILLIVSAFIAIRKGIEIDNLYLTLFGIGLFVLFIAVCNVYDKNKPEAIDVYRGKTTLQITYRDSIPVDSIVVFKNK